MDDFDKDEADDFGSDDDVVKGKGKGGDDNIPLDEALDEEEGLGEEDEYNDVDLF